MTRTIFQKVGKAIGVILLAFFLLGGLLIAVQDFMIFPGFAGTLLGAVPVRGKLLEETTLTSIKGFDGTSLEVWHQALPQGRQAKRTLLYFHGNGGFVDMTPLVQRAVDALDIDVYSLELRGYGNSEGWPTSETLHRDVDSFYRYITEEKGVSPDRLIIMGESLGSGLAAYLASKTKIRILIIMSGFTSLFDVVKDEPMYSFFRFFLRHELSVKHHLEVMRNRCIIIAHGTVDTIIPYEHSKINEQSVHQSSNVTHLRYEHRGHWLWDDITPGLQTALHDCMASS